MCVFAATNIWLNTCCLFETTQQLGRRERPKLVFAADGVTPTHLITSAQVPVRIDGFVMANSFCCRCGN